MKYQGTIIEESLKNKSVLDQLKITDTRVEEVTARHQTPWLKNWTLHAVEIPADKAEEMAKHIEQALEDEHNWYADYRNSETHYIIFKSRVFKIDRKYKEQYQAAKDHGISLGIPDYQVDFPAAFHDK